MDMNPTYADLIAHLEAARAALLNETGSETLELTMLAQAATVLDSITRSSVTAARMDGASWAQVGEAMGVSKQAAQQRYGHKEPRNVRQDPTLPLDTDDPNGEPPL